MSESLYISEIDEILENVSSVACRGSIMPRGTLDAVKETAIAILIARFGLNRDDAESSVASAAGEDL